ncbi:kinase-like domain-containing protein [Trichophaea hybrida]|nr:kinase-like domain-containing protein [Trichophaea hybrida]
MGPKIDSLREQIGTLRNTAVTEAIKECVQEFAVQEHQETTVVNWIIADGKILFGILIWRKWLNKLIKFIEHDVLDSKLPLEENLASRIVENVGWDFAHNAQWEFLPKTLEKEMSDYHSHIPDQVILPFINETRIGEGNFGEVFEMSVLPSLQTMIPEKNAEVIVVRKLLRKDRYLEREKECLQILNHLQHDNIVKLLASYRHCGNHHFLFPRLQMNLDQFLKSPERIGEFKNNFTFYTALHGLASALEKVHTLNLNAKDHDVELGRIGYHHDLKPANVLVDSRTFYLADFGLARLRPEDEGSRTDWKSGLADYVAPECMDENMKEQKVGRSLDIWSFGCMISEVAAYIDGGPSGVEDFRIQRLAPSHRSNMKNQYFFSQNNLKPKVISWFENFNAGSGSRVLRNLLEAALHMLNVKPTKRPKAEKVHDQLSFLSLEALFSAVQQALSQYLGMFQDQADRGIPFTTIQVENARLAAWGRVLQLTGSGKWLDGIEAIGDKAHDSRHILTSLLEKFNLNIKANETVSDLAATVSICKPFHEDLQRLIKKLCQLLSPKNQEKLRQEWLANSLDNNGEALQHIESSACSNQDSELRDLAKTKQEILHLISDDNHKSSAESARLKPNELQPGSNFSDIDGLSISRYHNKPVFVENVSHTSNWNEMPEPEREQYMQQMTEIFHSFFKRDGFRILECLGFVIPTSGVSNQHGCAFVWAFPTFKPQLSLQPKEPTPISLYSILKSRKKIELPLGARFQLAYKLVHCVGELNIVKWLHKNINSRNLVFFEGDGSGSALSEVLQNPYLVNFRYSRHAEKTSRTEKPANGMNLQHYQHPEYSPSEDFREIYDYYSIGIVLLELGSWTTLDEYLKHNKQTKSNPAAFRLELINKYAPRLDHIMGTTYRDVTLACLKSDFGQGSKEEGQTVLGEFYNKVVCPLSELSRSPI